MSGLGRIIVISIILIMLTGCNETASQFDSFSGVDPYLSNANAKATIEAGQAIKQGTQAAREGIELQMTADAAQAAQIVAAQTQAAQAAQATATAVVVATLDNLAAQGTAQAMSLEATAMAGNLQATQTTRMFEAQERALAIERARTNNTVRALFWYAITAIVVLLVAFILYQRARVVYFKRGLRGELGVIVVDGKTLLLPELAPTPVTRVDRQAPIEVDPAQWGVKANAQKVDLVRAIPQGPRGGVDQNLSGIVTDQFEFTYPRGIVDQVAPESVVTILDEVEAKLLDEPE